MNKTSLAMSIAVLVGGLGLAGCATSIDEAGNSGYSVTRATSPDGKTVSGYNLSVKDGKEYEARTITFTATPSGTVSFTVSEQKAKAFKGQGIAKEALSLLPGSLPFLMEPK